MTLEAVLDAPPAAAFPPPSPEPAPGPKPRPIDPARKVAIVGFASSSRDAAPYADKSFEIWSLNHAHQFVARWDRWFDVHPRASFTADADLAKLHFAWLKGHPGPGAENYRPVYTQERYDDIPASVRYPRDEVNDWLAHDCGRSETVVATGFHAPDYYTSSISHMLALAMFEGYGEIHVYGIDLLQEEEYFYQRAGTEYLVGFARGLGIKLFIPQQSALCKANYVYGFSEPASPEGALKPLIDFINAKAEQANGLMGRAAAEANVTDGAIQMTKLVEQWLAEETKAGTPDVIAGMLAKMLKKRDELVGRHKGAMEGVMTTRGQAEMAKTCGIWVGHYARGGKLVA